MEKYSSLEEICNKYNRVLVDTCAFIDYLGNPFSNEKSVIGKLKNEELENERVVWWREKIKKHKQIYITELVKEEIRIGSRYDYKVAIDKVPKKPFKELVSYRRLVRENKRVRLDILKLLEYENRILNIKKECNTFYEFFSEDFSDLKKVIQETDFDLLMSARILKNAGDLVSVISQDTKMFAEWREAIKKKSWERFDFYVSRGQFSFEKYYY